MPYEFRAVLPGDGWAAEIEPVAGSMRIVPILSFLVLEDATKPPVERFRHIAQVWNHETGKFVDPTAHPRFRGFNREGLNSQRIRVPAESLR